MIVKISLTKEELAAAVMLWLGENTNVEVRDNGSFDVQLCEESGSVTAEWNDA